MLRCHLPNDTVGSKGKPGLQYDGHNTSPVKNEAHLELHNHIMKSDVKDDEWKCMHKGKHEEGI